MKTLLAALLSSTISFAYGEEFKDETQASSFHRLGKNPLIIVTSPNADKDSMFNMNVEPGCILIRVKLVAKEKSHYTYQIIDSPGGDTMTKIAQQALGIKNSVFELAFSEKVSKIGDTEITSYMIEGITDKNNN